MIPSDRKKSSPRNLTRRRLVPARRANTINHNTKAAKRCKVGHLSLTTRSLCLITLQKRQVGSCLMPVFSLKNHRIVQTTAVAKATRIYLTPRILFTTKTTHIPIRSVLAEKMYTFNESRILFINLTDEITNSPLCSAHRLLVLLATKGVLLAPLTPIASKTSSLLPAKDAT